MLPKCVQISLYWIMLKNETNPNFIFIFYSRIRDSFVSWQLQCTSLIRYTIALNNIIRYYISYSRRKYSKYSFTFLTKSEPSVRGWEIYSYFSYTSFFIVTRDFFVVFLDIPIEFPFIIETGYVLFQDMIDIRIFYIRCRFK